MPKYRIKGPDGSTYEVTAPEGATQAEVLAYVQAQHKPAAQRKPTAYRVADKLGMGNVLGAYDALQHHLLNIPEAIGQGAAHGVNALVQGVAGGTDYAKGVQSRLDAQDAGLRKREADYQARTDGNLGSYAGATVGEVLPWMVGLGEARAAGLLPKVAKGQGFLGKSAEIAKKGGLLALEGAAMGAAQPVTGEGSYGAQKAGQVVATAGTGAALPVAGAAVSGAGRLVEPLLSSESAANRKLAAMIGPDAIGALRGAPQLVAGEQPSIAQVLTDNPRALQVERALRNNPHSAPAFVAQDNANNAARRAVAERLGGTPADMAAAKAARSAATDPFYQSLPGQRVDPSPIVAALDALDNTGMGTRPGIKGAVSSLRAELAARTGPDGKIDADILNGLHQNAGSHLGLTATAQEKRALGPIKDSIVNAIDAGVPGYRANNEAFSKLSTPINTMGAVRKLLDPNAPGSLDSSGGALLSAARVKALLRADDKAAFKMAPEARRELEQLRDSLNRRGISDKKVGTAASDTDANLQARSLLESPFIRKSLNGVGLISGGLLGHMTGVPVFGELAGAGLGANLGEGLAAINGKVMRKVGAKAANAQMAADALEAYRLKQKQRGLLTLPQYLLPYQP